MARDGMTRFLSYTVIRSLRELGRDYGSISAVTVRVLSAGTQILLRPSCLARGTDCRFHPATVELLGDVIGRTWIDQVVLR